MGVLIAESPIAELSNTADICQQSLNIGILQKQDRGSEKTYIIINLINKDTLVTGAKLENYFCLMVLS